MSKNDLMMSAVVQLNGEMEHEYGVLLRSKCNPEWSAYCLDLDSPPFGVENKTNESWVRQFSRTEFEQFIDELMEGCIKWDKPKWNGEGLPPVGVECEYKYKDHAKEFKRGVIKFAGDKLLVMDSGYEQCYHIDSLDFRPIKTEAEKERERLVNLAHEAIKAKTGGYVNISQNDVIETLIDAGWKCDTSQNGESYV